MKTHGPNVQRLLLGGGEHTARLEVYFPPCRNPRTRSLASSRTFTDKGFFYSRALTRRTCNYIDGQERERERKTRGLSADRHGKIFQPKRNESKLVAYKNILASFPPLSDETPGAPSFAAFRYLSFV